MFSMNIDEIRRNLKKFFRGEDTKEGITLINRWYHYFDDQPDQLHNYSDEEKSRLRNNLLEDISESINRTSQNRRLNKYTYQRNSSLSTITKLAAGFVIVLLASLAILSYQHFGFMSQQPEDITYEMVSNPAGQSSKITLADGSTVWLSAASTLQYPEKFKDSIRTVILRGEAFFDVAHDQNKPFVVNSGSLKTRVLGTSFNVRGFEEERSIQVTVASGRVAVERQVAAANRLSDSADSLSVLTPNQQLVFNKDTNTGVRKTVPIAQYTSWKEGKLIFDNHTFEEIALRLERWYGVRIHFSNSSLKQIHFKVTFENNSLEHALRMLQVIENFEFNMEGNQVWIK